ncbi:hypothetical protein Y032_0007g3320 [Ancylostoma ceylanicum]|uniref:Uncharacterized protein n=1 Tax=Ancylostoma ceylanicum TaxID=53326 RepID=A0A016VM06_9BILA|nr:hypothetical protein Y032_0007g3320 [Ancylostoma ceylanicum]
MFLIVVLFCMGMLASAQFPNFFPPSNENRLQCGFTCSRQARFSVVIDGSPTTATCTAANADPRERCYGCCQARALAAGLTTIDAAGFPSTIGNDCICCIYNRCRR